MPRHPKLHAIWNDTSCDMENLAAKAPIIVEFSRGLPPPLPASRVPRPASGGPRPAARGPRPAARGPRPRPAARVSWLASRGLRPVPRVPRPAARGPGPAACAAARVLQPLAYGVMCLGYNALQVPMSLGFRNFQKSRFQQMLSRFRVFRV